MDKDIKILYQQENFPLLQNRVYADRQDALHSPVGEICIVEDRRTGFVYNSAYQANLVKYDSEYDNEQSNSYLFQDHLQQVALIVEQYLGKKSLSEIGCGKAYFLELLRARGFEIFGCDPAYTGGSEYIYPFSFSQQSDNRAKGIILRHVLEHIAQPIEFLQKILQHYQSGLIYIEVPCWQWICTHRAWYDIYYEHVNYFTLDDFRRIFRKIINCGHLFHGQYIYVVADLASLQEPSSHVQNSVIFPDDFTANLLNHTKLARRKNSVIWGGASKGVIYSILQQRIGREIDYIIDINPAKQGKFTAVSAVSIISPEIALSILEPNETIVVMNENYMAEIAQLCHKRFNLIGVNDG